MPISGRALGKLPGACQAKAICVCLCHMNVTFAYGFKLSLTFYSSLRRGQTLIRASCSLA